MKNNIGIKEKNINISDSEWKIMQVLWKESNLTLKQISDALAYTDWSYTTIRTLVTRLAEKGFIGADKSQSNNFKYYPLVAEEDCQNKEVKSFLEKIFNGSKSAMALSLVKESNLSEDEQAKLMSLIDKMD